MCAPPSTCSRATGIMSSSLPSSATRLILREPCVLSRSPINSGRGSCLSATAVMPLEAHHWLRPGRDFGLTRPIVRTSAAMCSGVVPQQPPTMPTPKSLTNSRSVSAMGSGFIGYTVRPPSLMGSPAFGMQWIGVEAFSHR